MEDKKLILGLDVSSKTIGVSLFEDRGDHGKLLILTHVTPKVKPKPQSKIEELVKKVEIFEKEFLEEYSHFNISQVIIEEPLLQARNLYTVATLLKFNGMISHSVYRILGVSPEFISSYDARAFGFPELMAVRTHNKNGEPYTEKEIKKKEPTLFGAYPMDVDKKLVVWEKVADMEPQILWSRNRNKVIAKECFDMSDAYACVMGYMQKEGLWIPRDIH